MTKGSLKKKIKFRGMRCGLRLEVHSGLKHGGLLEINIIIQKLSMSQTQLDTIS